MRSFAIVFATVCDRLCNRLRSFVIVAFVSFASFASFAHLRSFATFAIGFDVCDFRIATVCDRLESSVIVCDFLRSFQIVCDRLRRLRSDRVIVCDRFVIVCDRFRLLVIVPIVCGSVALFAIAMIVCDRL
jgi:hypothetical protein